MMWVIEQNVFPADEEHRLISTLASLNLSHETFTSSDLRSRLPTVDPKTVLRGSCWLFQQFQAQPSWRSDLWGNEPAFEYRNYSARYATFLLNYPFTSVTFHELCWKRDEFLPYDSSAAFIRPDTGLKSIDGQLVTGGTFADWMEKCQILQLRGAAQLIVSHPRKIHEEYRCIVVDNNLIAASQYRPEYHRGCPDSVSQYVRHISNTVTPPSRVYAIDIAVTPEGPYVIEVGSVCCVALYEADATSVATHLSEVVEDA